jgi:hypothetical protein
MSLENSTTAQYRANLYPQGQNKANAITFNDELAINVTGATSVEIFIPVTARYGVDNLGHLLSLSTGQRLTIAKDNKKIEDFTINVISILYDQASAVFSFEGEIIESARWTDGFAMRQIFTALAISGSSSGGGGTLPTNLVKTDATNNTDIDIRSAVAGDFVALGTAHFGIAFVNDSTGETRINGTKVIVSADTTDIDLRTNSTTILKITQAGQITSDVSYVPLTNPDLATKAYVDSNAGGSTTLAGLTDVNIPTPLDNQVLTYDTATSKWLAETPASAPVRDYISIYKDSSYASGIAVTVSDPNTPVAVINALILTNVTSANFTNVNGLVTYSGPTKTFKITLDIALYASVFNDQKCFALVAKNADVFITDDFNKTLNYSRNTAIFAEGSSSVSFIKELTNTDVLRVYVVKDFGSSVTTINVNAMNLTVTEV